MKRLEALVQICDLYTFKEFKFGEDIGDATIAETLYDISIKLADSIYDCEWRSKKCNSQTFFRPIMTEDGVCFTSNSLNSQDIYTEEYDHLNLHSIPIIFRLFQYSSF